MNRLWGLLLLAVLGACSPTRYETPVYSYQESWAPPLKPSRGLIVIDPGHGGEDLGTKSLSDPVIPEKNLNLKTAQYLSEALEKKGFMTILTRSDDTFVPLKERAIFANERRPLLFVSVHFNAAPAKSAKGIEVFYYKTEEPDSRMKASRDLASAILGSLVIETGAPSRGVKHGNFAVIRETRMPAVLVEGGFLTNDEELKLLQNPKYLRRIAEAIANGVDRHVKS